MATTLPLCRYSVQKHFNMTLWSELFYTENKSDVPCVGGLVFPLLARPPEEDPGLLAASISCVETHCGPGGQTLSHTLRLDRNYGLLVAAAYRREPWLSKTNWSLKLL